MTEEEKQHLERAAIECHQCFCGSTMITSDGRRLHSARCAVKINKILKAHGFQNAVPEDGIKWNGIEVEVDPLLQKNEVALRAPGQPEVRITNIGPL